MTIIFQSPHQRSKITFVMCCSLGKVLTSQILFLKSTWISRGNYTQSVNFPAVMSCRAACLGPKKTCRLTQLWSLKFEATGSLHWRWRLPPSGRRGWLSGFTEAIRTSLSRILKSDSSGWRKAQKSLIHQAGKYLLSIYYVPGAFMSK